MLQKFINKLFKFSKKKLNEKIDEFINNINKNEEVNNFFDSCEILDEKKELKLREKINPYIKELQEKEAQSQEKALLAVYGSSQNQMTFSSQGETGETGESSSGQYGETGETKTNPFC